MRRRTRWTLVATFAALVTGIAGLAFANPSAAVCALGSAMPRPTSEEAELIARARQRIAGTFGQPEATPIVVFWQGGLLARFGLNATGGAAFLGFRACLIIGPNGRNPDVVAHELMHAEVFHRAGPWARHFHMPTWLDEGIAMQVDTRPRYAFPPGEASVFVRQLTAPAEFFVSGDEALTRNYAAAKHEVAQWLAVKGHQSLYPALARIRAGLTAEAALR